MREENTATGQNLLVGFDPGRVSLGGVWGDADNVGPVTGQLWLDVGELLHHLGTLPVTVVEHDNQVSGIFNFKYWYLNI